MVQASIAHQGYWVDWSKGKVHGQTITLSNDKAHILIAFFATFVYIVGSNFWSIFCFVAHQIRSDALARDGLYHQRQTILRNSSGPLSTLINLGRISWAWKDRAALVWRRQTPFIILAAAHLAIWTAATLLSSRVALSGANGLVLLKGIENCGIWPELSTKGKTNVDSWAIQRQLLQESGNYAKPCYPGVAQALSYPDACSSQKAFASSNINYAITTNVPCPFPDPKMCRISEEGAVRITSTLINSNTHLGLNAGPQDQINLRHERTCSALPDTPQDGFLTITGTDVFEGVAYQVSYNFTDPPLSTIYSDAAGLSQSPYHFDYATVYANTTPAENATYSAADGLRPEFGDLDIAILTNTALYSGTFNDTLFGPIDNNGTLMGRSYSAFGCVTTYQFCNPLNGLCTRKGGWEDIGHAKDGSFHLWDDDGLTAIQHATITNIQTAASFAQLGNIFSGLQADALLASTQQGFSDSGQTYSTPLANNQTVREMEYWFAISLVALQQSFIAVPTNPSARPDTFFAANPAANSLCNMQAAPSDAYTSFSFLGLLLLLILGSFIILTNIFLPSIVSTIQRTRDIGSYRRLEWRTNALLPLLQSAFESRAIGTWSTNPSGIPTTLPYQKFHLPVPDRPYTSSSTTQGINSHGVTYGHSAINAPPNTASSPTDRAAIVAGLVPGTTTLVNGVRYTAVATSSGRARGESIGTVDPPLLVRRDGERPASWIMGEQGGSEEQSVGLLRRDSRGLGDASPPLPPL
ncbi:hypothetical protein BT63DRAFT_442960 [Microthyrium microscopicum]|uniref:Uncharacterized protein n=1 Tax=Microthyrium microscopicum TaxID=703497 RepID=A0A6A6U2F0_9PEZI|nr:hypothetical protein BT63DRAFT_442960 [Microthyrium microscopicum]